jgi:hypothetical protein
MPPPKHSPGLVDPNLIRELLRVLAEGNVETFFYEDAKIKLKIDRGSGASTRGGSERRRKVRRES